MAPDRATSGATFADVLDRVLDKGIVIEARARVLVLGVDVLGVEARVVVASIATYVALAERQRRLAGRGRGLPAPPAGGASSGRLRGEAGCTFEWRRPRRSVRCPYRPGARCALVPSAA